MFGNVHVDIAGCWSSRMSNMIKLSQVEDLESNPELKQAKKGNMVKKV
jgi:hypothetical protein